MTYRIIIPIQKMMNGKWNKTPSLNDYIKAERTTFRSRNGKLLTKGALMKKEWQGYFSNYIRKYMKLTKIEKPIIVHYYYYEADHKRDWGNVHAPVQKFFEDALQDCGVISNDNQNFIKGFTADFTVDKNNPKIIIELEEVEEKIE